jgi:diguanylate cyclase (GGDEF)-like protein
MWTIERIVRMSIVAISAAAILTMALVSWKLVRDAGDETMRELTEVSVATVQARISDSVQRQIHEFRQIAASTAISTALMDSRGGREGYLEPFLEQRTQSTGLIFALYDYRGRLLVRTGPPNGPIGASLMAGEPVGATLRDVEFRVSKDQIEFEAPFRFFADNKPIGFLVGSLNPALLTSETALATSRFYSVNVSFYVTSAFVEQRWHMKIVETPRATLAARIELTPHTSWVNAMLRKLTIVGFAATVAVFLASILVARWAAKAISSPIGELTEALEKLRNGEKAPRPSASMPSEIKGLASALFLAFEERGAALQKLQNLAHYDGVTGALSRAYFDHRARNVLQAALRTKDPVTLLYIDLDRFKEINDAFGHDAGDLLLQALVTRARTRLRSVDLIGRRGGDEFVVFLPQTGSPAAIEAIAQDLSRLMTAPLEIDGETCVQVGVSIGASVFPDDAETYDALVTCADKAMYEAKKAGRGRLSFATGRTVELAPAEPQAERRHGVF